MKWSAWIAVVAMTTCGCAGASYKLVAPSVPAPVSATGAVFGPQGEVLRVPDQLEVVAHFALEQSHWAILWSLVSLGPRQHDLSAVLEEKLRAHHGDAIVNLEVTTSNHGGYNLLGVIPLVPTATTARIEGDVVRLRSGSVTSP